MSSRKFNARTTHSTSDPQICGLHEVSGCSHAIELDPDKGPEDVPGAIKAKDECFYLTCKGNEASVKEQIQSSTKKNGYSTGFRVTPSGRTREVGKCRSGHGSQQECEQDSCTRGNWYRKKIYKWQEQKADERWYDVLVWERMAHTACAHEAGYTVPADATKAHRGARTKGYGHKVKPDPISGLEELATLDL